ncbi:hypothetical protein GF420_00635 [candidate division GN15 bacterium]|nr:hypothetical protein [candidate division GN15 bacterium]
MEERIMTQHPDGKQGVNILTRRYTAIRIAILSELRERGEMTFKDLMARLTERLADSFDGKVGWYVVTVKLDLEARGTIERIPGKSPQRLRLAAAN